MSTFVPLFHRRWVRVSLVLGSVLAIGVGGLYGTFYYLSSFERLQKFSAEVMEGSSRKIIFDAQVERDLFPRPTVVLHNVTLSETDGRTPAVNIKQVRVGVSWASVLGKWTVEKLVLSDLATVVSRDDAGVWNFADLLKSDVSPKVQFNRVQLDNGQVMLQAFGRRVQLNHVNYHQSRQDGDSIPYVLSMEASHAAWNKLAVNIQGHAQNTHEGWQSPDMVLRFDGEESEGTFSGSFVSTIGFQQGQFIGKDNKLTLRTDRLTGHADVNIAQIRGERDYLLLNNINSVFTGSLNDYRMNGTLTARQAKLDPNQLASDELTVNLTAQTSTSDNVNININSAANWQMQKGVYFPKFQLTTRQDRPNGLPRFVSEWTGSLNITNAKNWQMQAQGQFDRYPIALDLKREHNTLNGTFQLAKIDLANYMDSFENRTDATYPAILSGELVSNLDIDIGSLSLPALEVNNIKTTLRANRDEVKCEPFSADLYSGHSEGMLSINNQSPIQYVMKQKAEGVQVRPMMQDLFRSGHIAGKGDVELSFTTTGATRQELTENLSGSLNMNVKNGYWYGINIRELMKAAATNGEDSNHSPVNLNTSKDGGTPFDTFEFKSKITQGVSKHSTQSHFTNPIVSMAAKGETNLYSGRMSEDINILSNNGKDTLPLRITGTMENPAISLNYQKITSGLKTPEQKKEAVTDAIKKQWDWIREQGKNNK